MAADAVSKNIEQARRQVLAQRGLVQIGQNMATNKLFGNLRALPKVDQSLMTELDNEAGELKKRIEDVHARGLRVIAARHRQAKIDEDAIQTGEDFIKQMEAVIGDNLPPPEGPANADDLRAELAKAKNGAG